MNAKKWKSPLANRVSFFAKLFANIKDGMDDLSTEKICHIVAFIIAFNNAEREILRNALELCEGMWESVAFNVWGLFDILDIEEIAFGRSFDWREFEDEDGEYSRHAYDLSLIYYDIMVEPTYDESIALSFDTALEYLYVMLKSVAPEGILPEVPLYQANEYLILGIRNKLADYYA